MRKPRLLSGMLFVALTVGAALAQDVAPVIHVANPLNLVEQQSKHYVVLVSLDGFRYDYPKEYGTPHLDAMAKDGVSTPTGMYPSYPSVTFPNHWTLVTGLRPEHHGIVANSFFDPLRDAAKDPTHGTYWMADPVSSIDGSWYGGTPLWVLAEQQGMRSACFFWPGSEAAIQGVRPSYYMKYDDKFDDEKRIDQVIAWLKLPADQRPHFITLYYANTDHSGHKYGPDAPETRDQVHHVDELVGELREKLKATGLAVDLIVTADHGMAKLDPKPIILDEFAEVLKDPKKFDTRAELVYAKTEADAERAYEEFRAHPDPRFTAYRRLDVPKELEYSASAREGDPVIVMHGAYAISVHPSTRPAPVGSHGFPPHQVPQMKAIFFAEGPDVAAGVVLPSFDNIDVYPFVVKLLGLESAPVDGTIGPLEKALKQ
jgi:predicted AlkP superfamily pyrophosphatase or phosphodiesterase